MLTYSNFIHFRHDGKIHVGQLYVFAVVGYREHGETQEQGRTLFAQVRPYDDDGIVKRDVCGAYKYKTEATVRIRKKIWIHATRLCTYLHVQTAWVRQICGRTQTTCQLCSRR